MIPKWAPMYSWWIQDGVMHRLHWRTDELGRPSSKMAALMVYIAITIKVSEGGSGLSTKITYNKISEITGVSRQLIREGILILEKLDIISIQKVGKNNIYSLINNRSQGGWCKIPVKAIMSEDGRFITPFEELKLRRKVEFHAIKLFLYLASVRDNHKEYSMASYETISKAIGISNTDISRALTLLSIVGILARVSSSKDDGQKINQPNCYYLAGYKGFFRQNNPND